ncbi:glycerol-3-phosphate acyltransferase [Pandoraea sp. PE-S2R-1]|uniref:glycerol-3-phosphate acyltransferase n=1 Tax=Pandoraea sp. PE-S2R-1 TaxID=1986994 RepID=UPI001130458F|nr:glycerol-3-phosphate acyltransferase [Pandoraea sp. PE-S2R-1]
MTYLASHPGLATTGMGALRLLKVKASAVNTRPSRPGDLTLDNTKATAGAVGCSIAGKRDVIAAQFVALANTKQGMHKDAADVEALQKKFERAYAKATSGYLKGGMWDGCWRYAEMKGKWWPHYLVAHQLDVTDIDQLTPSAKRFTLILDHMSEALLQEQEALAKCSELGLLKAEDKALEAQGGEAEWAGRERTAILSRKRVIEIAEHRDNARKALARASEQVWPDKKHYGRRLAISGGLYGVAAAVGVIGLAVASLGVAIVAFAVTLVLRVVSLGSIRGYDRERSWKSAESLLEATKEFINCEGDAMKTEIWLAHSDVMSRQLNMIWDGQQRMSGDLQQTQRTLENLATKHDVFASDMNSKMDGLREDMRSLARATGVHPSPFRSGALNPVSSPFPSLPSTPLSSTFSTPVGTPPRDRPAPLVRALSCSQLTFDASRLA